MKIKNYKSVILAAFVVAAGVSSCVDKDNEGLTYNQVIVENAYPDGLPSGAEIVSGKISFKELNTGEVTSLALPQLSPYLLPSGIYDVEASATVRYQSGEDGTVEKHLRSVSSAVQLTSESMIPLNWFFYNDESSLIFNEIYFTGSLNATATGGLRDSYFTIYNNTDEVIYADGLGIAESALINARASAYEVLTPANDRSKNFTAGTVWVIPGSGKDVPIAPGESLKIADQAIDWNAQVAGALNHTDADFEWYDNHNQDTDNPGVPNLDKWYCYSVSIWIASNQCNRSYALVRFPEGMTAEEYLAGYHGAYDYISVIGTQMRNEKAYLIPNEWIIDGVNLSNKEAWVYGALGTSIDMSFASVSDKDKDTDRFGKKFRRRTAATMADGRVVLTDTNDSATDFELVKAN